ncbi:hypothetical protein BDN72DRAFT_903091 [Pluteus cervinus]|uniref:Uncharacterized protein n=1 Tax=Pluteus cervinus TaxID=181527 RepID=A0ACD3AB12_9AGAR|nr:hypothetical protein BDN72DRAFT_903091 [Pluteus cervinus]
MKTEQAFEYITGKVLGPMPPLEFINAFLPAPTQGRGRQSKPHDTSTFSQFLSAKASEVHQNWVDALEPYCGRTITQVDTHQFPVFNENGKSFGPQVCVYHSSMKQGSEPPPPFLDMRIVEMPIHFTTKADDPFDDKGYIEFTPRFSEKFDATLGEMAQCALMQLSIQYRTHVFSMLVTEKYVRFLRWDRAGVIVTRKISLTREGHLVATFFQRLQYASPCARGIDETVTTPRLSAPQAALIRKTLEIEADVPLLQVTISGRRFIFGNDAFFRTEFSRSTRCFKAYNLDMKPGEGRRGVFKDSWRFIDGLGMNEFERYQKLQRAGVKNIPAVWCGEDVLGSESTLTRRMVDGALYHETRMEDYRSARWVIGRRVFDTYRHYRQVVEELDGPLTSCRNMKDVVTALRDASQAQAEAFDLADTIHADSSLSNVMIKYEGDQVRGYLIDWDLSKDTDVTAVGGVGQFKYMAARLVNGRYFRAADPQDHIDDMESLFHDLVYVMAYYTDIVFTPDSIGWWKAYFNEEGKLYGMDRAGNTKVEYMKAGGSNNGRGGGNNPIKCPPLGALVEKLGKAFYSRYQWGPCVMFNKDTKTKEAREQFGELMDNPYWMSQVLTEALTWTGWPEEKLLKELNDPSEADIKSTDWDDVVKAMKERNESRRQTRKRRKLH